METVFSEKTLEMFHRGLLTGTALHRKIVKQLIDDKIYKDYFYDNL